MGDDTITAKSSPVQIGSSSWTAIAAGNAHSLAIRSDGLLFTWGNGNAGALGDGTTVSKSSPVQIGSSSWTAIAAGNALSLGIRSDGLLFTWGIGTSGQLGDGTTVSKSSPVQIGSSSWITGAASNLYAFAIRSDNTLFAWGDGNTNAVLGNGYFVSRSSPVQVASDVSFAHVSTTGFNMPGVLALSTTGLLYSWGRNTGGALGNLHAVRASSPSLVGNSSWIAVAASADQHTHLAIRSDGLLFAWGVNAYGQLGDNLAINRARNSPIQIGSNSWTAIAASFGHSLAIRSDGLLFTWGRNNYGQLGDNTTVNKSSPVQIGSNSWVAVSTTRDFSSAIRSDGLLTGRWNSSFKKFSCANRVK
jgi:alpha-tubulin suppressor-like RCC1 family protein